MGYLASSWGVIHHSLGLSRVIRFQGLDFSYNPQGPKGLNVIKLHNCKVKKTGINGTTGSGENTIFDLLMELLKSIAGYILVDGLNLYDQIILNGLLHGEQESHMCLKAYFLPTAQLQRILLLVFLEPRLIVAS
jgi:ABC-type transport system involved in cytochrome bd biosynthesis fused ATPase/permease subunit